MKKTYMVGKAPTEIVVTSVRVESDVLVLREGMQVCLSAEELTRAKEIAGPSVSLTEVCESEKAQKVMDLEGLDEVFEPVQEKKRK